MRPHISRSFRFAKAFNQVSHGRALWLPPVLYPIGQQDEIAEIALALTNCITFGDNVQSPLRRFGHYEVFVISPSCARLSSCRFLSSSCRQSQIPGKAQPLIGTALVVEVYMDIDSPLVTYTFPPVLAALPIVPFISEAHGIQPPHHRGNFPS